MEGDSFSGWATAAVGLIVVAGILYTALSAAPGMPSGFAVAPGSGCCGDCSCVVEEACGSCGGRCIWNSGCGTFWGSLNPEGLELVHPARVEDGGAFTLNVVLSPEKDETMILLLHLPNGFALEGDNPLVLRLRGGATSVTPLRISVKEHVAEQDHLIAAELIDYNWKTVSRAEATVNVWWGEGL